MNIRDLTVREIFDSRGDPTIEAALTNKDGRVFTAQIPSGKSRGSREAAVFEYPKAAETLERLVTPKLIREKINSARDLDDLLIRLDETPNKARIGGNLALGVSIAAARALASEKNVPLWKLLADEFFLSVRARRPVIFSNFINGGAHADTNLAIQEYLVLMRPKESAADDIRTLIRFYRELGAELKRRTGLKRLPLGDEGGYAVDFKNNFEPIALLESLIKKLGLEKNCSLGLDVAASQFFASREYAFEGTKRTTEKLSTVYDEYLRASPLLASLEDPFHEEDANGFATFSKKHPDTLVIGDDLTATNPALIKQYAEEGCVSGVIIKPNQIGTVSETCEAIKVAHKHDVKCIISHRSGETEDTFIIHLARASGAYGVKIGAPAKERMLKFNELIRLYDG